MSANHQLIKFMGLYHRLLRMMHQSTKSYINIQNRMSIVYTVIQTSMYKIKQSFEFQETLQDKVGV